ncbi:MAG: 50S ribosomal protein L10 [Bacilli bacterium]|nr:50S ribosomal protein L10 [Bacilli bacterium]
MNQAIIDAKKAVVTEVAEKMKSAKSTVIVEYRGLTVAEVTELRNSLREENVELKVYKNKLVQRATTAEGYEALNEDLVGPNALAFGHDDAVAPARILAKFAKKHDALVIKSGIVEGRVLPKEEIMAVSSLPGREGMYSMLLCCLKEPVAKVARVVKAVAEAKEGAAPAAEEAVPAAE